MKSPRMNPRRWFWLLVVSSLLWCWTFGASAGSTANSTVPQRIQHFVAVPVQTMLAPGTRLFEKTQQAVNWTVDRARVANQREASVEEYKRYVAILEAENARKDGIIAEDSENLRRANAIAPPGLTNNDLVSASRVSLSSGNGVNFMQIRPNASRPIELGMPVIADGAIIGRIESVGAICNVRLITDPRMKMQAIVVRWTKQGTERITPNRVVQVQGKPQVEEVRCLVEGVGNGRLQCNTLPVKDAPRSIEPGDILQLLDNEWPRSLRYMALGDVTAVDRKEENIQRYKLTIAPRVNFNSLDTVWIVLSTQ